MGWWHALGFWYWEHRENFAVLQANTTTLATIVEGAVAIQWLRRHQAQKLAEQRLSAALEVLKLFDDSIFTLRRYVHSGGELELLETRPGHLRVTRPGRCDSEPLL